MSPESEVEVQIEGYTFIAKSRASGQGGGVGVYISSSIPFQRRMDLEQEDIECISSGLKYYFLKLKAFLLGLFIALRILLNISAQISITNLNACFSTVSAENKECILSGNINCNCLVPSDHKEIKSILSYFGLKQLISSPTRITRESKTLIDVICCNVPHNIFSVKVIPAGLSDHELIGCARKLNNVKFNPRIVTCRNFANYNPKLFCEELNSANLVEVYSFISVNEAWASLRVTLQRCIDKHAPLISKKVKGRLCPWLTPDVRKEMNLRDGLLRKARPTNQEIDWSSYKRQRNRVSGLVKKCKSTYNRDLLKDCADSPDKFWAAIKKLYPTKLPSEQGSAFVINGSKSTDKSFIANSFCEYFSTVARNLKSKSILLRDFVWSKPAEENLPNQVAESQFTFKAVKELEILKELKNLKRKKASGLDNFPPGLLKDAALVLTKPLTFIINLSLETGVVPSEWKVAKVIPLYKSGSLAEIDNYRPISILPTLSKILEKIVYKQLMAHLERHSLLFEYQFGFRPNRSTELAVTYFTDLIRKEADNGKATGAVFIDLSKAFDTISHSVLLCKLTRYGVYDMELQWFTDYLFLRKQIVQFNGVLSEPNPINTGVPQGSILGPLLFLIFFNDVHSPLRHCKIITYADDTVIFTSSSDFDVIQSNLSQDLDNLSNWFRDNELIFNLKKGKSEVMLFGTGKRLNLFQGCQVKLSVNDSPINTTTCYKYLGVHLDPTLNFETHFQKMYKKAAGRVNLLRRIRSNIDTLSAQRIYQSMIMPIFTYCGYNSLGWSESRKRMIRSIETRSLEIISPKCSPQNCDLRFLTIDNFLQKRACCFVFDCLNGTTCFPFKDYFERFHNALNTRNSGKSARLPKVKLDFARRSFYFLGASIFNSLPLSLRNINSRVLFRNALDDYYL